VNVVHVGPELAAVAVDHKAVNDGGFHVAEFAGLAEVAVLGRVDLFFFNNQQRPRDG
jgi:hypothetical protein